MDIVFTLEHIPAHSARAQRKVGVYQGLCLDAAPYALLSQDKKWFWCSG